jgi:uncharacterized membrane-anchored protein
MKQADMDLMLAKAQVFFSAIMLLGIFALVFVLIFFHGQITATALTIITTVITALVTILTLQMNFFYARQRPSALPDPTTTSTTITTTTTPTPMVVPSGSTVVQIPGPPSAIVPVDQIPKV